MLPVKTQLIYILLTVGLGIFLGFCYDLYSAFLHYRRPKKLMRWVWDFIFCLVLFLLLVYYLIRLVWGDLRLWLAVALVVGWYFYYRCVRRKKIFLTGRTKAAGLAKKLANKDKVEKEF